MGLSAFRSAHLLLVSVAGASLAYAEPVEPFAFPQAQTLLKTYCVSCHQGKSSAGGVDLARFTNLDSLLKEPRVWDSVVARVRENEMPPKGLPAPSLAHKESFVQWVGSTLKAAACATGPIPGPAPLRRLNRNEYSATIRDLLNIHINAGHALPADGAGGEGFDNAAETLFFSPIHAEKYVEAAKNALEYAAKDPKARAAFMIAEPNATTTPEQAARKVLSAFLPKAFRRPIVAGEVERYLALFRHSQRRGETFDNSMQLSLASVLVSPHFLFRLEELNTQPAPALLNDYALATRLSYFLWGSLPDAALSELAAQGKLQQPEVLQEQVVRLLKDLKAREFAEHFVEQWLGTRELGRDIKPDAKLFPAYYDAELQSAIRYEPILFFQEILAENHSLLNLIDAKFSILTNKLQRHYGLDIKGMNQQPKHADLPEGSRRGGILNMAAVLAVSSYPQRTSPVLRGKWILEAVLGTPPPPPPPNVPELKDEHEGTAPKTLRERLTQHRQNPACASCHNRIDPLGFALENYDVLGQWRTTEAGKPIDSTGALPDGTQIDGAQQLKQVLLERKGLFLRNLTAKMLGYALGRGLMREDYCTVDQIVDKLEKENYSAHTLVREIVLSVPFRYQAAMPAVTALPSKSPVARKAPHKENL